MDLRCRRPGEDEPTRGREWSPQRQIRAQVLFQLLTGHGHSNSVSIDSMRSSRPMLVHAWRAALQWRIRSLSAGSSRARRTSVKPTEYGSGIAWYSGSARSYRARAQS